MMLIARLLLFILFAPGVLQAQVLRIGIYIDQQTAIESIPASFFLIDGILEPQMVASLMISGKPVWVASELNFTRSFDLRHHPDSISNSLLDPIIYYRRSGLAIETYIMGKHPQASSDIITFFEKSLPELQSLTTATPAVITTPKSAHTFAGLNLVEIVSIADYADLERSSDFLHLFLLPEFVQTDPANNLRFILDHAIDSNQTIIIPLSLLESVSDYDSQIWPLLREYITADTPVFAINQFSTKLSAHNEITGILLFVCWLFFGLFFFANGAYHRSLSRYFFTHNFFVNDVMNRRLKPESEVLVGLLVTSMFSGLFAVIMYEQLDTWLIGRLMDVHGFWFFSYFQSYIAIFTVGALSMLTGITGIILWLTAAGAGKISINQSTQIVLYPMHVILPLASVLAIFQLNDVSGALPFLLGIVGFLTLLLCMPVCSLDVWGFMMQQQKRFTLAGPVLYTTMLLGILIWILFNTPAADTLLLIVYLLG